MLQTDKKEVSMKLIIHQVPFENTSKSSAFENIIKEIPL